MSKMSKTTHVNPMESIEDLVDIYFSTRQIK